MKKAILTIVLFVVIVGGYFLWQKQTTQDTATTIPKISELETRTFISADQSITLKYPENISVSQKNNIITLHHQIPYKNTGACDMKEEGKTYTNLTDFHVTIKLYNQTVASTSKIVSPYISEENIQGDTFKISLGFIDSYSSNTWNGYMIYEGAEGCGQTTYYIPISSSRTLVIQRESIQAISGVRGGDQKEKILAIPGVISQEQSNTFFDSIIQSLKIR